MDNSFDTSDLDKEQLQKITKDFARNLKELRNEKDMTQHDLTDKSGLSLRMISDMERGIRQPSLITLFKLAKGLDMTVLELIQRLLKTEK